MSQVEFEEFQTQSYCDNSIDTSPKIVQWVVNYSGGLIKTKKQVMYFLVAFVIISTIIFVSVFVFGGPNTKSPMGPMIEQAGSPSEISSY